MAFQVLGTLERLASQTQSISAHLSLKLVQRGNIAYEMYSNIIQYRDFSRYNQTFCANILLEYFQNYKKLRMAFFTAKCNTV